MPQLPNPNWKWQNEPPNGRWDIGETRDNHLFIDAEPNRNLWAAEDKDWIDIGTADFQLTHPLWLGIYAGVATGRGTLQTEFEYFRDNLN